MPQRLSLDAMARYRFHQPIPVLSPTLRFALHRLVVRALDTWRHLATSASTPSTIILAPSLGGHRVPGVEGGQPANTAEQVRKLSRSDEGEGMYRQQDRQGNVLPEPCFQQLLQGTWRVLASTCVYAMQYVVKMEAGF